MNVVIVEDQAILRDLLHVYMMKGCGAAAVQATGLGREAVDLAIGLRADLLVLDLHLPDMPGLEVHARIQASVRGARTLVLSGYSDVATLRRVRAAGVHGFIDKATLGVDVLNEGVRHVTAGREYFPAMPRPAEGVERQCARILSDRELEVLSLIGDACSDREIGRALGISDRTAQTHRSNILRKLEIASTPKLIRFAQEHGLARQLRRPA